MCYLICTNIDWKAKHHQKMIQVYDRYAKRRGPISTTIKNDHDIYCIHYHLNINGSQQPVEKKDTILLWNGEIYDAKESEYQLIWNAYKTQQWETLNGEFTILVLERSTQLLWIIRDVFGTKPLYFQKRKFGKKEEFLFSSFFHSNSSIYFSESYLLPSNRVLLFDCQQKIFLSTHYPLIVWNFSQYKTSLDDFHTALETSVLQKATYNNSQQHELLINLSSGHDSGLLCCILNKLKINYHTMTIGNKEDQTILRQRWKINQAMTQTSIHIRKYSRLSEMLPSFQIHLKVFQENRSIHVDLHQDQGFQSLLKLYMKLPKNHSIRIILCTNGCDEIFSDYGFQGHTFSIFSNFGGQFPNDLESLFLNQWENFYEGLQRLYLMKEEIAGGYFGLECRYPFLDPAVIQEFLWLHPDIKNRGYKYCIESYLEKNSYPFRPSTKIPFRPLT